MSTVATGRRGSAPNRTAIAAAVGAVATVAAFVVAESVSDVFYLVAMAVGVATAVLGVRARRDAKRSGFTGRLPLAATIVGALPAVAVIVYSIVYGISKL